MAESIVLKIDEASHATPGKVFGCFKKNENPRKDII